MDRKEAEKAYDHYVTQVAWSLAKCKYPLDLSMMMAAVDAPVDYGLELKEILSLAGKSKSDLEQDAMERAKKLEA